MYSRVKNIDNRPGITLTEEIADYSLMGYRILRYMRWEWAHSKTQISLQPLCGGRQKKTFKRETGLSLIAFLNTLIGAVPGKYPPHRHLIPHLPSSLRRADSKAARTTHHGESYAEYDIFYPVTKTVGTHNPVSSD